MNKSDITLFQLKEIMWALLADTWIVRFIPSQTAESNTKPISQAYNRGQFLSAYKFMRLKNANGYHVYGRPLTNRHVLVDDVCEDYIDQMIADALRPAAIVETSRGNFQVWITLSGEQLPDLLAAQASRIIARKYGADKGCTDIMHLGRLPGFTNRKSMHEDANGQFPFTRLIQRTGRAPRRGVAPAAERLLDAARQELATLPPPLSSTLGGCDPFLMFQPGEADEIYKNVAKEIKTRFGESHFLNDRSRLDYAVVRSLNLKGFSRDEAINIILNGSNKAQERGHYYAAHTVYRAFDR